MAGMTIPVLNPMPAGYVAQAADMNALGSACTFLLGKPLTKVRDGTGGQTITSGSATAVTFTLADFDTDGMWNVSSSTRLTIQTPGFYKFRGGVNLTVPGSNASGLSAWLVSTTGANNPAGAGINSSQHWPAYSQAVSAGPQLPCAMAGLWPVYMYALDYIQLFCDFISLAASTTQSVTNVGSYLSMEWVSV